MCTWIYLDCVTSQSEDDFLEESDFDDISIHSASVLSDALTATTKKKSKSRRKKKKSRWGQTFLWFWRDEWGKEGSCNLKTIQP